MRSYSVKNMSAYADQNHARSLATARLDGVIVEEGEPKKLFQDPKDALTDTGISFPSSVINNAIQKFFEKKACEIERLFYFAPKNALTKLGK